METATIEIDVLTGLEKLSKSARRLVQLSDEEIRAILYDIADITGQHHDLILRENRKDLDRMDPANPKYDRLLLNPDRLIAIENDIRAVADLPSPLGRILEERHTDAGLHLKKISVPLGVIGIVYESRPNVTFDVIALCLKSGNASALKGSRDAHFSNLAIVQLIKEVLMKYGLEDAIYLAPSARESLSFILEATNYIDIIIPRGSQGLINFVRDHAKVPVIETGAGIVHTYYDHSADLELGKNIIVNAKTRRVSVCNALDTLLIHKDRVNDLLVIFEGLDLENSLEIFADDISYEVLKNHYDRNLLHGATVEDFGTEFLSMKMSIKVVESMEQALDHIAKYSSKHSEAIIASDQETIDHFFKNVDAAAVYANTSTAFTDGGQFGLGAEIGISTQKLHARGPMGLAEITSYKWIISSNGLTRP